MGLCPKIKFYTGQMVDKNGNLGIEALKWQMLPMKSIIIGYFQNEYSNYAYRGLFICDNHQLFREILGKKYAFATEMPRYSDLPCGHIQTFFVTTMKLSDF